MNSLELSFICDSASLAVLGTVQLAYPSCDSPDTSCFTSRLVQAICLVGENPTCSVPALQGCEGLWSYGHTATAMHDVEYPPPSTPAKRLPGFVSREAVGCAFLRSSSTCSLTTRRCCVTLRHLGRPCSKSRTYRLNPRGTCAAVLSVNDSRKFQQRSTLFSLDIYVYVYCT